MHTSEYVTYDEDWMSSGGHCVEGSCVLNTPPDSLLYTQFQVMPMSSLLRRARLRHTRNAIDSERIYMECESFWRLRHRYRVNRLLKGCENKIYQGLDRGLWSSVAC